MNMLRLTFLSVIFLCFVSFIHAQTNEGEKLYQEALFYMEGIGDYAAAIEKFGKVAQEYAANRPLAARALLMMGKCHEKLGRQEAKDTYNRIIENYGDQREVVIEARSRLLALSERLQKTDASDLTVRRIWEDLGNAWLLGSVSPDGRYLSFVEMGTRALATREQSTKDVRRLTGKGLWAESSEYAGPNIFSPDGRYIAYGWFKHGIFDLRIINIETEEVTVLYAGEDGRWVEPYDWSADGQYLLVLLMRGMTLQMGMLSVTDGSLSILKTLDFPFPGNIVFSPDGKYIAYDNPPFEDPDQRNIYLIDVEHERESVLIEHPSENIVIGWSPDGNHLLFVSDRAGTMGIWLLPMENGKSAGEPRMIKSNIGQPVRPLALTENGRFYYGLAPDGRDVYYASLDIENNPVVGIPERISQRFVGLNNTPDWSPDGGKIAYSSSRKLRRFFLRDTIVIYSFETGQEHTLSPEIHRISGRLRWTPDGKSIIVTGETKPHHSGIYIINATTGAITDAIDRDSVNVEYQPDLSPDGDYLYYFKNILAKNAAQLISYNMETKEEVVLYSVPGGEYWLGNILISNDGHYLAFTEIARKDGKLKRTLQVISLHEDAGEPRTLFTASEPEYISQILSFKGNEILFLVGGEDTSEEKTIRELLTLDIKSGSVLKIATLDFMGSVNNIRLHPDGKSVVFEMGRHSYEVWMIENLLPESEVVE